MKKIGILYGIEKSFPQTLINYLNSKKNGIKASEVKIGALKSTDKPQYNLILDRISHQVPMYISYLKFCKLNGVYVINNPFWNCADNNFMHTVFAVKNKFKTPKTVLLPSKEIPEGTAHETLHNLIYPLNWDDIFDYIGFPAYLKPNDGHNSLYTYKVYNPSEFFSAYDISGRKNMIIQEALDYEAYYRVFVIRKELVRIVSYDPIKPLHLRYTNEPLNLSIKLKNEIVKIAKLISTHFDYDFNSIEFAIKDNNLYVMDFLNAAPKCDREILDSNSFDWLLENTAQMLIDYVNQSDNK